MASTVLLPPPAAPPVRSLAPAAFPSSDGIPMESRTVANMYDGHQRRWLRWAYPDGTLLLTTEEQREVEAQHAAEQAVRAEQADRHAAAHARRAEEESQRAAAHARRAEEESRHATEVMRLAEEAGHRVSLAEAQAAEEARQRREAEARCSLPAREAPGDRD